MALKTPEQQAEWQKYFPNKEANTTDQANIDKFGTGIIKKTYENITKPGETTTPGASGQQASTADLSPTQQKMDKISGQMSKLYSTQGMATDILNAALEAKNNQYRKFNKVVAKQKQNIAGVTVADFANQGLTPEGALDAAVSQIQEYRYKMDIANKQKTDAQASVDKAIAQAQQYITGIIQAKGLTLDQLGLKLTNEREDQNTAIQLAFSQAGLLSGVMPPGVPDSLKASWEAQSNLAKAAAASSGSGGSGRGGSRSSGKDTSAADEKAFYTDIYNMQKNLSSGLIDWGQAWNTMAAKYGTEGGDVYDTLLDKEKWSQPGAYEATLTNKKQASTLPDSVTTAIENWANTEN